MKLSADIALLEEFINDPKVIAEAQYEVSDKPFNPRQDAVIGAATQRHGIPYPEGNFLFGNLCADLRDAESE